MKVQPAEDSLGVNDAAFSRRAEPRERFYVVLRQSIALAIVVGEKELGEWVTVVRRGREPLGRLGIVLGNAQAFGVDDAQFVLRLGQSLLRGRGE